MAGGEITANCYIKENKVVSNNNKKTKKETQHSGAMRLLECTGGPLPASLGGTACRAVWLACGTSSLDSQSCDTELPAG